MSKLALIAALAGCSAAPPPGARTPQPPRRPPASRRAEPEVAIAALTPDAVLATIRADYLGGVRRCYAHALKRARTAARVTVSFTVDADGRAQEGAANGNAPHIDACVTSLIARWQFPRPRESSSFRLVLRLEPE